MGSRLGEHGRCAGRTVRTRAGPRLRGRALPMEDRVCGRPTENAWVNDNTPLSAASIRPLSLVDSGGQAFPFRCLAGGQRYGPARGYLESFGRAGIGPGEEA